MQAQSCWAESASVDEYVVVSGVTGVGAYVVWHCTVKTLKGGDLEIRKRYVGHVSICRCSMTDSEIGTPSSMPSVMTSSSPSRTPKP